jgi:hypothetical protein
MRLKVLSLFLAVQFASFALWQGVQALEQKNTPNTAVTVSRTAVVIHPEDTLNSAPSTPQESAKPKLNQIRFSEGVDGQNYQPLDTQRKDELMQVMGKLPNEQLSNLKNLILDDNPDANRGLGGKSLIILRGVGMGKTEEAAVLLHEIGHNVDLGYLTSPDNSTPSEFKDGKSVVYQGDPSLDFYRISWSNEKTRNREAVNFDFVSGYAMTDPFEDFAETYAYYILHNRDFLAKTQTSDPLLQKYNFMKNEVFKGRVFDTGVAEEGQMLNQRPWDVTVLSYNLNKFLEG